MQSQTWDFMKAMVQLTRPLKSELFPHTFLFDEERLIKLRADMLDMVNLEICMRLYRILDTQSKSSRDETPTNSFASSPCDRPASPADDTEYSSPTIPSLHDFDMTRPSRQDHGHAMGHPLGKQSWMTKVDGSYANSSVSSPRSSPSSTASTPDTLPPTPLYLTPVSSDSVSASQLRTSLLAIL
ncbi:hypothetical protein IFR05_017579, partial [Cadophora sp. M221]